MPYLHRSLEPVVRKAVAEFPVVALSGPRQSGKTTLLRRILAGSHRYVSLEPPDVRLAANEDPRGFLAQQAPPVILDEVQCAPGLLPYVKEAVDEHRSTPGQFVLTGSQNLLLNERITESLAGRVAALTLLPMSNREAAGNPAAPLPWETAHLAPAAGPAHMELWSALLRGGYPELVANPQRDIGLWHASYVQTYLERDVRTLRSVGDLLQFQVFLRALAARSAQLLNMSELARDIGVAVNTVRAWLSVLEATHQVIILRPYFANVGKRLVKAPKVYFGDTGTLCHLVGLAEPEHAMRGPMAGAMLETAVVAELVRSLTHRGVPPQLYFWRTSTGQEVDVLVGVGTELVPIEVKASATPRPDMAASIKAFRTDFPDRAAPGYVVHAGDTTLPLGGGVTAIPFAAL